MMLFLCWRFEQCLACLYFKKIIKERCIFLNQGEMARKIYTLPCPVLTLNTSSTLQGLKDAILRVFSENTLYGSELGHLKQMCEKLTSTLEINMRKVAQFHKEVRGRYGGVVQRSVGESRQHVCIVFLRDAFQKLSIVCQNTEIRS